MADAELALNAARITIAREMAIRDAALLEAAKWVEEASFRDIIGICSKRKREREDALLRAEVAHEERRYLADCIRRRVANRVDRIDDMLRDVANGSFGNRRGLSTADLADVFLLAQRGLVEISVEATIAGSWNCATPDTVWRVRLSERGEKEVAALSQASSSTAPSP